VFQPVDLHDMGRGGGSVHPHITHPPVAVFEGGGRCLELGVEAWWWHLVTQSRYVAPSATDGIYGGVPWRGGGALGRFKRRPLVHVVHSNCRSTTILCLQTHLAARAGITGARCSIHRPRSQHGGVAKPDGQGRRQMPPLRAVAPPSVGAPPV